MLHTHPARIASGSSRGRLAPVAFLLLLSACDIPTSAPNWETRWLVRTEGMSISVGSLLPGQVTESADEFVFSVAGGAIVRTLGDICQPCAPLHGLFAPKPAFTTTMQSQIPFPVDLDSIVLTRGSIRIRVTNGMSFDPIRPSAAPGSAHGQITITVRNGSMVLGVHTIDGAATDFAPGATLLETVTFTQAGLPRTIGGTVGLEVTMTSPAGDPVMIDTASFVTTEAADAAVGASAAMVRVQDRMVSATPMTLDLAGIDAELTDRVQRGSLLLDIDNPFAVGGTMTATLSAPGVNLVRALQVVPGASQVTLAYSGAELRSLFGNATVTISVAGPLSAVPAGVLTLLPNRQLTASGRLEIHVSTNSPEDAP